MITFELLPHQERLAPSDTYVNEVFDYPPLYHQVRTWKAFSKHNVVLNTYNTGTGKTIASLLPLLDRRCEDVLFIAPTNALIEQHAQDIVNFVANHNLDYRVIMARASDISTLKNSDMSRSGELLHRLIQNYAEFDRQVTHRQPVIVITNPDIFYYALYFGYGSHDQRNVFIDFVRQFNYLIVDEFHYYNNKQMANFLFAFALFDELGYFEVKDRRVCLLSATPRDNVMQYFNHLLGDRLVEIAPHNEPEESSDYDLVPTLSPLRVHVTTEAIEDWVIHQQKTLTRWVKESGSDGVIISNSLARINRIYSLLSSTWSDVLGRITGPEPPDARQKATAKKLILATPTVDIGYNFDKLNKPDRQNIDFVICESRFQDDLLQRIGRAGRVLGKSKVDNYSDAVVVLPQSALEMFRELDGKQLSRMDFSRWLRNNTSLPVKHQLDAYLRYYAIPELARPIIHLRRIMPQSEWSRMDALYERLYKLFVSNGKGTRWQAESFYKAMEKRKRWLVAVEKPQRVPPTGTNHQIADWLEWLEPENGHINPDEIRNEVVFKFWNDRNHREELINFVRSQYHLANGLFNFRDSFSGPSAVLFDPYGWFSTEKVNVYDLFHLLQEYLLKFMSPKNFRQLADSVTEADFYVQLLKRRQQPLKIVLTLNTDLTKQEFDQRWSRVPCALNGLRVHLRDNNRMVVDGAADEAEDAIRTAYVISLIVPSENSGTVYLRLKESGLYSYPLIVNFGDGNRDENYSVYPGLAAYEAYSELKQYFNRLKWRERPVIIC